jgi:hypothetical protein
MSAAILQFPVRRPEPTPTAAPGKIDISEHECRLLDQTKAAIDNTLDVVNTDVRLIRSFLIGDKMIQRRIKFQGVEYDVRISLEPVTNDGPRFA